MISTKTAIQKEAQCVLTKIALLFLASGIVAARASETEPVRFSSGPEGPGKFGAYYTSLHYLPDWESGWRVAEHPDVVVRFEETGGKLVFWRGVSYIPCYTRQSHWRE